MPGWMCGGDECRGGCLHGWMKQWMDEWIYEWMEGWMGSWMGGRGRKGGRPKINEWIV